MGLYLNIGLGIASFFLSQSACEAYNCAKTHFRPVCGNNRILYENVCWMIFYNYYSYEDVRRTRIVFCKRKDDEDCPCIPPTYCETEDNPICAFDAKTHRNVTFTNLCHFQCESQCNSNTYFRSCGGCETDPQTLQYDGCLYDLTKGGGSEYGTKTTAKRPKYRPETTTNDPETVAEKYQEYGQSKNYIGREPENNETTEDTISELYRMLAALKD